MNPSQFHNLLEIFNAALKSVNGRSRVRSVLSVNDIHKPVYIIAIGKAASAMTLGAVDVLGNEIDSGLVITKHNHLDVALLRDTRFECIEAGHPVPDEASLDAGDKLVEFIISAQVDAQFLFLISGGASSLVEVLPEGVSFETLCRVNDWLLGSGLDISHINYVRKALSCIKGGKLISLLGDRKILALLISDVPGDDPSVIGSGLLVQDSSSPKYRAPMVPDWIQVLLDKSSNDAVDTSQSDIQIKVIASISDAMQAAAQKAEQQGYKTVVHHEILQGDAGNTGAVLAQTLLSSNPGIQIWGGETTVQLPVTPGVGGRNQSLALSAAIEMQGRQGVYLLAAATDGSDGPGEDAGALVDGLTVERASIDDLSYQDACKMLTLADAGTFLQASGDLIQTGPTGTNVMDLVIGLNLDSST